MDKNYNQLMDDITNKVQQELSQSSGRDSFFLYTLDNFAYRYLEDDKAQASTTKKSDEGIYQADAKTTSMKLAMQYCPDHQKTELANKIKQVMGAGQKASTNQQIFIDAKDLNDEGEGLIIIKAILNWDFPQHVDEKQQKVWTHKFEVEDWGFLRKKLALYLEEVCEVF